MQDAMLSKQRISPPQPNVQDVLEFFPHDFQGSRKRFLETAHQLGAKITTHQLETATPALQGQLTIDIAYLGDVSASNVVLHVAGTHGIEGFVGSAVQHAIMRELQPPQPGNAFVFVHCLNPWGMSMLRRTNEDNVDLNRNSIMNDAERRGTPEGYEYIRPLLMPNGATPFPLFACKAMLKVLGHGFPAVKQSVTQGQFEFPTGLYFAGKALQPELVFFHGWLKDHLSQAKKIIAIDVHSGLGDFGRDYLILDDVVGSEEYNRVVKIFGEQKVEGSDPKTSVAYVSIGSLRSLVQDALPNCELSGIVQEFGTYHSFKVIHALIEENRRFYAGHGGALETRDSSLMKVFCPASSEWRMQAIRNGVEVFSLAQAGIRVLERS
jgi:hypothetical protein